MKVSVVEDLGAAVGEMWQRRQEGRVRFNVAAPLSSTPLPIYSWVVGNHTAFDLRSHNFVLMDEQVEGLEEPFSYVDSQDRASAPST